jgi:hypothetical protein
MMMAAQAIDSHDDDDENDQHEELEQVEEEDAEREEKELERVPSDELTSRHLKISEAQGGRRAGTLPAATRARQTGKSPPSRDSRRDRRQDTGKQLDAATGAVPGNHTPEVSATTDQIGRPDSTSYSGPTQFHGNAALFDEMRARVCRDTESGTEAELLRQHRAEYEVLYADDSQSHASGLGGKPYYHHIPTGVTSWDPPPCLQEHTHGQRALTELHDPSARAQEQALEQEMTRAPEPDAETEAKAVARKAKAELAAALEQDQWASRTARALEELRDLAMEKIPQPGRVEENEHNPGYGKSNSATIRITFSVVEDWFRGQSSSTVAQHWLPRSAMSTRSKWWAAVDDIVQQAATVWVQQGYGSENGWPSVDESSHTRGRDGGIDEAELERMLTMLRPVPQGKGQRGR